MLNIPHASESPSLAVVTVSYGSQTVLPEFLESVRRTAGDVPIVVADNKPSADSPIEAIASEFDAHYLSVPGNPGYGAAINAAVAQLPAHIEWVVVCNPDVVVHDGAVAALLEVAASDATIAAVGPAILTAEGTVYPSARRVPGLGTGAGHALLSGIWPNNPWSRGYREEGRTDAERDAGWLSGACLLIRRSAFNEAKGFDPEFFMYFEDVDLGYRFGRLGYRNVFVPTAVVTHTGAHSTQSNPAGMLDAHHDSARRFLNKKYSGALLLPVRIITSCALAVRQLVVRSRVGKTHK